jgi:hypothetical protein
LTPQFASIRYPARSKKNKASSEGQTTLLFRLESDRAAWPDNRPGALEDQFQFRWNVG